MRIVLLLLDDDFATRLPLARALRDRGDEVLVMTPAPAQLPDGFLRIPWSLERGGLHPLRELRALVEVIAAYRRWRPDLVHHVAHKPIVYGGIAALVARVPAVNTVTGLGYVGLATTRRARWLRRALVPALRWLLARPCARTIVQNHDDLRVLGVRATVIRGSGVDLTRFRPDAPVDTPSAGSAGPGGELARSRPGATREAGVPIVVYAGRLLVEKGVRELAAAARILAARGITVRVVLVGERDPANPGSIDPGELTRWIASGAVEHRGARSDMPDVLREAAVVCVPSWGEGLPKVLLEAAACGCAIVTTDAPGCRELVRDGIEGRLVPPRDPVALADAIAELLARPDLRAELGRRARTRVEAGFGHGTIVAQTLAVHDGLVRAAPRMGLALRAAHRVNAIVRRHVYHSAPVTRLVFGVRVAPVDDLSYFELGTLAMQRTLRRELGDGMRVLEIGTGPHALLARWAARRWQLAVTATEIEPRWARATGGITVRCTDMFEGMADRFDRVWFVPPMTPAAILSRQLAGVPIAQRRLLERRANGGDRGWEVIDRFLGGLRPVLAPGGRGYVTINSAHVAPAVIEARIRRHGLAIAGTERALAYVTFIVG